MSNLFISRENDSENKIDYSLIYNKLLILNILNITIKNLQGK